MVKIIDLTGLLWSQHLDLSLSRLEYKQAPKVYMFMNFMYMMMSFYMNV